MEYVCTLGPCLVVVGTALVHYGKTPRGILRLIRLILDPQDR